MQILVRTHHPEAAQLRETVERRARFAFRRLKALVPRADITLDDINGPGAVRTNAARLHCAPTAQAQWWWCPWPRTGDVRWTKHWPVRHAICCAPGAATIRLAGSSGATAWHKLPANTKHPWPIQPDP